MELAIKLKVEMILRWVKMVEDFQKGECEMIELKKINILPKEG